MLHVLPWRPLEVFGSSWENPDSGDLSLLDFLESTPFAPAAPWVCELMAGALRPRCHTSAPQGVCRCLTRVAEGLLFVRTPRVLGCAGVAREAMCTIWILGSLLRSTRSVLGFTSCDSLGAATIFHSRDKIRPHVSRASREVLWLLMAPAAQPRFPMEIAVGSGSGRAAAPPGDDG